MGNLRNCRVQVPTQSPLDSRLLGIDGRGAVGTLDVSLTRFGVEHSIGPSGMGEELGGFDRWECEHGQRT